MPSTRADCPLRGQHKRTKKRRQLCPAHYKGRAQNVPWDQEEENLALPLWRAESGSPRKKFKRKMSPMHATRIEQGTMRKPRTKVDCRAKKPRKLIEFVPKPCFEHGAWKRELCPALGAGRAAFHAPRPRQARTTPHQTTPQRTKSCPALHKGRAASWKPLSHGLKIGLKIQFNSFLHQIKSPSKCQNPIIESV